ncbi:MAG: hypothetical protein GY820_12480 [Gammaproteobacteria bacterium]|nr:hypothetical protein [Gammaproteobacteria bacterium]
MSDIATKRRSDFFSSIHRNNGDGAIFCPRVGVVILSANHIPLCPPWRVYRHTMTTPPLAADWTRGKKSLRRGDFFNFQLN